MLATRDLSELPEESNSWQNRHLTYTHGFGVVASQVNTANEQGQPVFLASNIPPAGAGRGRARRASRASTSARSRNPRYNLVRTDAVELDFESPDGTDAGARPSTTARAGSAIGTLLRRLAFALRFGDYNLRADQLHHRRVADHLQPPGQRPGPADRAVPRARRRALPGGHRGSRQVDRRRATRPPTSTRTRERATLRLGGRQVPVNYVRNSVKAVVDAYDGDVTLYRVEDDDPILDAWEEVFPGVVTPGRRGARRDRGPLPLPAGPVPPAGRPVPRPTTSPTRRAFYNRADAWSIPRDPALAANQRDRHGDRPDRGASQRLLEPYYLLMRLPGEETEEFVLIQPYLARGRENMVAWLAGRSDGENLNELFAVRFPTDSQVLGPLQAQARIEQDDDISAYITLRDRDGVARASAATCRCCRSRTRCCTCSRCSCSTRRPRSPSSPASCW